MSRSGGAFDFKKRERSLAFLSRELVHPGLNLSERGVHIDDHGCIVAVASRCALMDSDVGADHCFSDLIIGGIVLAYVSIALFQHLSFDRRERGWPSCFLESSGSIEPQLGSDPKGGEWQSADTRWGRSAVEYYVYSA